MFAEAQVRSQKFFNYFSYHEYKGGIGYNFPKKISVALAMGQYVTYNPEGNFKSPVSNSEYRLWEQFILNNNIATLKLEHRYRIEQRFTSAGYRNRFRYRFGSVYPINKRDIENNTFYITASEEIFLTDKAPNFQQNRLFAGLGYQFTPQFILQIGWMSQYTAGTTNITAHKNYLQTSFLFSLQQEGFKKENIPGVVD